MLIKSTIAVLLVGAASIALAADRPEAERRTAPEASAAQLLDPTYMTGRVCGKSSERARQFQNRLAMAMGKRNKEPEPAPEDLPPLFDGLSSLTFPITTKSDEAQRYFDQGFALTYGFNHWEAVRAFKAAQAFDPECAMCYWGEAFALGPNINAPMSESAVAPAWAAVQHAVALKDKASAKERALIDALAKRYSPDPEADRAALDAAFADAMAKVHAAYPDDDDIAAFYVESVMDTQPWDYWEANGGKLKGRAADALPVLESVLDRNPNHAASIHLYIHMVEASNDPYRAEAPADRLLNLVPGSGHLIHMPSHIYYRIGRFKESIAANIRASKEDEEYLAAVPEAEGIYVAGYYPHNVHFVTASAQMAGDKETALEWGEKLDGLISAEAAIEIPLAQPIKAAPLYVHAQFSDPETILALEKPDDRMPYIVGMWHYARAIAHAERGDFDAAQGEIDAIKHLQDNADFTSLTEWNIPGAETLEVARLVAQARVEGRQGNWKDAALTLESAVEAQQALPYTEPPFWYYPVQQSLGAAYILSGDAESAEQTLKEALVPYPNNAWVLFGLAESQKALGDKGGEEGTRQAFGRAWMGTPDLLVLERL